MTSYAFTLNLGLLVGGVGVRYRLYARRGVDAGTIGQVVGTSVLTNWVGYLLLAAVLPGCGHRRRWQAGVHPHGNGAWAAPCWAAFHWLTVCCVRCARGGPHAAGPRVCTALLARGLVANGCVGRQLDADGCRAVGHAAGAGELPRGLGTVLLGAVAGWCCGFPLAWGAGSRGRGPADQPQPGAGQVLAALLAYRALYYFVPLVLASLALGAAELRWRHSAAAPAKN